MSGLSADVLEQVKRILDAAARRLLEEEELRSEGLEDVAAWEGGGGTSCNHDNGGMNE